MSGDYGLLFNAEVYTPNLCPGGGSVATQCRLLWFYDSAYVSRNHPGTGEASYTTIAATGFGWRVLWGRYLSAQMDLGRVVNDGGISGKSQHQMHFRLNFTY